MQTAKFPSPAMKLFVPSIGSITQLRPAGSATSTVMSRPSADSSPMIPSPGCAARSRSTISACAARSATVTASSVVESWVFVSRCTPCAWCRRTNPAASRATSSARARSRRRWSVSASGAVWVIGAC